MKTLKSSISLFTILMMFFYSCQTKAQKNISAEELSSKQTVMQVKQLDLNKNQAAKLKSINLDYAQQMLELRKEGRIKENREALIKLNIAQNQEVKSILNEEQFQKYLSLKNKNRKRLRRAVQGTRAVGRQNQNENVAKLDLNTDQIEQMKGIKSKYTELKRELRKDKVKETIQELQNINEKQDAEVKAVLSDEQYQTYLEMMKERRERLNEKMQNRRMNKQKQ